VKIQDVVSSSSAVLPLFAIDEARAKRKSFVRVEETLAAPVNSSNIFFLAKQSVSITAMHGFKKLQACCQLHETMNKSLFKSLL
jgi:hypothetical protein